MMTIGEFARCAGLSVSALRFYANRGLLEPAQIDRHTGYRRYGPDQVADGRLVRDLRRLNMPLIEIAAALALTDRARQDLVTEHVRRLERTLERARSIAHMMHAEPTTNEVTMQTATLSAADLADAVTQVLPAAGTDPEQPHLMGVLIEGKAGSIRLVATDRHRLAVRDLVPSSLTEDFSTVVPAATLDRWRRELALTTGRTPTTEPTPTTGSRPTTELSVALDKRDLTITGAGIDLAAPRLPTTFPDYEPYLAQREGATTVLVDRSALLRAIQGMAADETAIHVTTDGTSIRLARGNEENRIGASIDGPGQQIGINPRFLAEAVQHAVGPEVTVEITTPLDPVVVRSADDGTYVSMIMPFTID